jgi:PAS domain S-box-containing protein
MGWSNGDQAGLAGQRAIQVRYFAVGLALLAASAVIWPLLGHNLANLQFMPHIFCYLGNPTLISVNLISDLLIGSSYVVISLTLVYLVRASKGGIPFHWMFLAFGTFIIACGGTHFMEVITLWHPVYWASAYVKVITAVASVFTAVALPLAIPGVLGNIASIRLSEERAAELAKANAKLSIANEKLLDMDRLRRRFVAQTAANVGDWEWNIQSGTVRWSEEVEEMHGLPRGSFAGTAEHWVSALHPDDRERVQAAVTAAVSNRTEYDVEYRTLRPDGTAYWTAARGATEYDPNGDATRMVGMCMDITSRKQTEEMLRRSEKLAAAGRLAATIAHEINNPLEAAINLLYLARLEESAEARTLLLDMADRELQRVGHITRQSLGFYRETSSPVLLDMTEILRRVLDLFQGKLNSRSITATVEGQPDVQASGVPGELTQVFSNLVGNAIDASASNSRIRIRVKGIGSAVQVTIADQGAGISSKLRGQIFEPFFTTKKDVGTGLGLWISRQIIENHGGSIRYRSVTMPGKSGTVFVVRLGRRKAAVGTAA